MRWGLEAARAGVVWELLLHKTDKVGKEEW